MQKKNAINKLLLFFFITVTSYAQTPCEFGLSANFPCNNIEFVGQVSLADFGAGSIAGNDCWGWTDPLTNIEYAIMGLDNGTGFVDISDPVNPILKTFLPSKNFSSSTWRDIKVYNNYAFIVSEAPGHGMQIFDLTHLRDAVIIPTEDAYLGTFGHAHNIAINEDTGYAYIIGADDYNGGPIFINIQDPLNPINEGGYGGEGYTHDAHIITYNGPDTEHNGKEIYIGANADHVTIVDVTNKNAPTTIANIVYSNTGYTHQLWLDQNHKYLYVGDEFDEQQTGANTRTLVFDLTNLNLPILQTEYFGPTPAIDHNNYTNNNKLYLANYTAGLRIIDVTDVENNNMSEIGFFDTFLPNNNNSFNGLWSVYPYFSSGNIIISDFDEGLMIVKENVTNIPPPEVSLPNDCSNNIIVCGNTEIELNVDGPGEINEINSSNSCSSGENNSVWFEVTIEDAGTDNTLGFTLTPESNDIGEDYDFWVFGPNVTCDNLGTAIRCSTTNPSAAQQGNNLTGMSGTETDFFEGPAEDGNSFVHWLDNVQADETYFIVLDRPEGDSPLSLTWTGTASFAEPPSNQMSPSFTLNQVDCDTDGNGLENFDLSLLEDLVVGNQDVSVTYHEDLFLAELGQLSISPSNYAASVGTTIIYLRLTDNVTECFSIFEMELTVNNVSINQPPDLFACDDNSDGFTVFNLTQQDIIISGIANNPNLTYYTTTGGGNTVINDPVNYTNTIANQQTIFARLDDPSLFNCYGEISFIINVYETPIANPVSNWFICDDDDQNIGFFNFDLETLNEQVLLNQDQNQFLISYHSSQSDADINSNALPLIYTNQIALTQETIFVRIENKDNSDCFDTTVFDINVFENPIINLDLTEYFCINISNYSTELDVTTQGNYTYQWTDENDNLLANTQNYTVTQTGNYTLTVSTTDGNNCTIIRTVNVLPSEPATITNTIINEYLTENNFSVEVEITGSGIYEYAIDDENGTYQNEPIFLNVSEGIHEIFVREIHGCGTVSIEVAVFSFPRFFTPNGDGDNEFWKTGLTFQPNAKITIFDRFGKVMTQITPSLNQAWDGLYKNNPAPETDYWFIAELINSKGEKIIRKGHFSLIRI